MLRKRFGQHFLTDRRYIERIVAAIDPRRDEVMIEIGPGGGALTDPLLQRVARLHVVEIDRDLCAALRTRFPAERLEVHEADALAFDFGALGDAVRVVGNLPYNISTPLLFRFVALASHVRDLHFMLQKEVVDRMAAAPSTADYGRLTVMLQHRFRVEKLFEVPPGAFRPPPKVESAVVRLVPRSGTAGDAHIDEKLAQVVTAGFTKRRKTLRNALAGVCDANLLERLGVDPKLRPENLSVDDYERIAAALQDLVPDPDA